MSPLFNRANTLLRMTKWLSLLGAIMFLVFASTARLQKALLDRRREGASLSLLDACAKRDLARVRRALARGASPNYSGGLFGGTPLLVATQKGDVPIVRELLDAGADSNQTEWQGGTALMVAASFGQPEVARLLVARGADVHRRDQMGKTAADYARESGSPLLARQLTPTPPHPGETMIFTELAGMILLEDPDAAAEGLRSHRERGQPLCRWGYERGANHVHADMSAGDRERVREETAIAAEIEGALRHAYPSRSFVISHIPGYAVSFYQLTDDAPTEGEAPIAEPENTAWCQHCQRYQPVHPLPEPDAEFPGLRWGACAACGRDLLLDRHEHCWVVRGTPACGSVAGTM